MNAPVVVPAAVHGEGVVLPHELWSSWSLEPLVLAGLAISAGLYLRGVLRLWRRAGTGSGVRRWQVACFAAGLFATFVALVSPLDPLGETLFSAHMVQHEVLMRIAAPLLVLAAPLPALLWGLPVEWRSRLGRLAARPPIARPWAFLTHPVVAWSVHALVLWGWHVPALYQLSITSDLAHGIQHTAFLASALLFWWVLVHRGRGGRVAYGIGVLYIFTTAIHESLLGVLFVFADRLWYPVYSAEAIAAWGLTPMEDQQLAGLVMWIPGGFIYLVAGLAAFVAWLGAIGRERRRAARAGAAALGAVLLLGGCTGIQSSLDPATADAGRIADLWWTMLAVSGILWAVLMSTLAWGILRGRGEPQSDAGLRRRAFLWAAGGTGLTVVVLLGIFAASLGISHQSRATAREAERTVEIVGHQYWWEVRYPDPESGDTVVSANELHLPAGSATRIRVTSADVIHSLWIPALGGKIDMIPGDTNRIVVHPEETGRFRGQCAEFCGLQHALMALPVVVHTPDAFDAWLTRVAEPALPPPDSLAERGLEVLARSECAGCHTIRGTPVQGPTGPDLTHMASRLTLAAGTLENTEENLRMWLAAPQELKRGNLMPAVPLSAEDFEAVVHYLRGLR